MTVKRRLFLSSLLMILILVLVGNAILHVGRQVFLESRLAEGIEYGYFQHEIDKIVTVSQETAPRGDAAMSNMVRLFNEEHAVKGVHLALWGKNGLLEGRLIWPKPEAPQMGNPTSYTVRSGRSIMHILPVDGYEVILQSDDLVQDRPSKDTIFYYYVLTSVAVMVVAVILINYFLNRFIFRRVTSSIGTLMEGVGEIRDGNLDYHIEYRGKDEFAELCLAFNEMAVRLKESVDRRVRDEQSRRELIAGISHDLRTPLTSIRAYVEGLESGVASTPEMRERYLATIRNKADGLERLIQQLFQFSKLDTHTFPLNLERLDLCREAAVITERLSSEYFYRGLAVRFIGQSEGVESEPAWVLADKTQLINAITNIVENSLKYKIKPVGELTVHCWRSPGSVLLTLQDDGPGVPEADLERIFDVFYRCDPSRSNSNKGSGLGLSITARILAQLGGSIRAANVSEGGLAITLAFPTYDQKQQTTGELHEQNHTDN